MAGLKVRIGADTSEFTKGVRSVKSGISSIAGAVGGIYAINKAFDLLSFSVQKVGDFMKDSSQEASNFEMLGVMFETLTGSASEAEKMIKDFRDEAQKSPLSITDYANAGKTLMAFGANAQDVMPVLSMLGDISMANSDRFRALSLAFAQTQAAGRLMGQEVLQFVNAGFNPLQEISRKTGESMKDLKKRMEDGGVSASEVAEAFKSATSEGGRFFGAIERGADTFAGKLAKFNDAVLTLKISFGEGMNDGLKSALEKSNEILPQLEAKFKEAGQIVGGAIKRAVEGDIEGFVKIGELIGTSLLTGIEVAFTQAMKTTTRNFWRGLEEINPIRKIPGMDSEQNRISNLVESQRGMLLQSQTAEGGRNVSAALQELRAATLRIENERTGQTFRPARPGETNTGWFDPRTGEAMVEVLKKIESNTSPAFAH